MTVSYIMVEVGTASRPGRREEKVEADWRSATRRIARAEP